MSRHILGAVLKLLSVCVCVCVWLSQRGGDTHAAD